MQLPPEFAVQTECLPGNAYVVHVSGEIDLYTAPRLENELVCLARSEPTHVTVDLTDAPFLDSTGLAVLLAGARLMGPERFALTGVGIESRRVIEITGADRVLTVVERGKAAVA